MMKLYESYGLCPYMAEMQREMKRNARIRELEDCEQFETDDPAAERLLQKEKARFIHRESRPTKTRWVAMAAEASRLMNLQDPTERDGVRNYIQAVKDQIENTDRRKKSKRWVRTDKAVLAERYSFEL